MKQCLDSATFWINKIRREAHDRMDKKPQEWCTAVITMLKELITLITEHFPEGFKWNEKGVSVADAPAAPAAPAPAAPATAPVEPMQGKVDLQKEVGVCVWSERQLQNAVKNGGLGLKHVEKSEMTSKNPSLRGNVKMAEKKEKWAFRWGVRSRVVMAKPPRCEKVQAKWMVENQTESVEVMAKINETVYVLGCVGATIRVKDKCKSIIVDGCRKCNVIFDKCVSTVEVVNCKWALEGSFRVGRARCSAWCRCLRWLSTRPMDARSSSRAAVWTRSAF